MGKERLKHEGARFRKEERVDELHKNYNQIKWMCCGRNR